MSPDVRIQIWDMDEVERRAADLDDAASAAEPSLRKAACEIAWCFRHAGRALEFVDEDDADVVFDLLTRLEQLVREADVLVLKIQTSAASLGEEETTRVWVRPEPAPETFAGQEITAVRVRAPRVFGMPFEARERAIGAREGCG